MNIKIVTAAALALVFIAPGSAAAKDKKHIQRGMLEKMQAIPCGVKERGLTSLGGLWAGIGIQHVNSNEKLCPQYLFRTDEMDYSIRPLDQKHAALLPVGQEAEFKIKKDKLYLRVGDHKMRPYQVVGMEQPSSGGETESTSYKPASRASDSRAPDKDKTQIIDKQPPEDNQARTNPPRQ